MAKKNIPAFRPKQRVCFEEERNHPLGFVTEVSAADPECVMVLWDGHAKPQLMSAFQLAPAPMPTIREATVEQLAEELCRRMAAGKPTGGILGELDTVDEAKDICHDILKAAKRNGMSGCDLCGS